MSNPLPQKSLTSRILWDHLGIGVSTICTIHCLIVPAAISLLPFWPAASVLHEWSHPVFIIILIPVVWFASKRSHFNPKVSGLLIVGLLFVILGWVPGHSLYGGALEIPLTLLGSAILISGHWHNYRHHRVCTNTSHRHHPVGKPES